MDSVESFCNQLAISKLMAADAVRTIHKRWCDEVPKGGDDAARFGKWLVANGFLTDFQVGVLQRGFADLLFLDDYKLLERIGQGRMAGVYKAVHKLGQVVAVKVLPLAKGKDPQLLGRFQREARMAARLRHPNCVRTFQVGKTKSGLHYIVMEYLGGETLEDVLTRRGKLPLEEALHIGTQALRGVGHIEAEGLVHRDLKPGNLMLVPTPGETVLGSQVKILDIGLGRSHFEESASDESDELTTDGIILGTPLYMAPEQARSSHTADIRADIYSLGCVLYHALTGQPPFPDVSSVEQIMRHASEQPKSLSVFLPSAPAWLQELLNKMLAKDPAQRFATAAAALKAFENLPHGSPATSLSADANAPMPSFVKWLERHAGGEGEPTPAPRPAAAPAALKPPPPAAKPLPGIGESAATPVARPTPAPTTGKKKAFEYIAVPLEKPPAKRQEKKRRLPLSPAGWCRRDVLSAVIGAGVVAGAVVLIWVLWRVFW